MPKTVVVSATNLVRRFGDYARTALADPVQIAQHGQIRLALVNAELMENLLERQEGNPARLEARFDILFDSIEPMVTLVDVSGNIVRTNCSARRFLGIAQGEVEGRPLHTLLNVAQKSALPAAVARVVSSGQAEDFFWDSQRYPGRTFHTRIIPFPGGAALFANDVTDAKTATRIDATRTALISALDVAGIGAGSINIRGIIEQASQALERLTGASSIKLLNVRLSSLFTVRCRDAVVSLVEKILSRGEGGMIDCELLTEQGPLAASLSIAPVEALDGGTGATFLIRAI